jgi:hypothetical protein
MEKASCVLELTRHRNNAELTIATLKDAMNRGQVVEPEGFEAAYNAVAWHFEQAITKAEQALDGADFEALLEDAKVQSGVRELRFQVSAKTEDLPLRQPL